MALANSLTRPGQHRQHFRQTDRQTDRRRQTQTDTDRHRHNRQTHQMNTLCEQQSKQQKNAPTQATKLTNPSSIKCKETKHAQMSKMKRNASHTPRHNTHGQIRLNWCGFTSSPNREVPITPSTSGRSRTSQQNNVMRHDDPQRK